MVLVEFNVNTGLSSGLDSLGTLKINKRIIAQLQVVQSRALPLYCCPGMGNCSGLDE